METEHLLFQNNIKQWIAIGGAEQHLGLQCLMNRYRSINKEYKIGYAENVFDVNSDQNKLCVGTEGIVYTTGEYLLARIVNKHNVSKKAKVFRFIVDEKNNKRDVYCVYGLSAMMTKIALMTLLVAMKENKNKFIPGKRYRDAVDIKEYDLTDEGHITVDAKIEDSPKQVFETDLGKKCDSQDMMNNANCLVNELKKAMKGV